MKNTVGYKEGGQNIYRIMQMSQEYHDGEEGREAEENYSESFVFPKNQSEEKRNTSVSGKEEVVAGKNAIESFFVKKD